MIEEVIKNEANQINDLWDEITMVVKDEIYE